MKFKDILIGCTDIHTINIRTNDPGIYFVFHSEDKQKLIDMLGGCPVKKHSLYVMYNKIVISVILSEVGFNITEFRETAGLYHQCKYFENSYCRAMKNMPCVSCKGVKYRCEQ